MIAKKEARILVVDDEKQVADVLVDYLSNLGYQTVAAYSGYDALSKFKDGDFQLIITDLKMPEMDGMELLDAAKRLDKRVVVVVITGLWQLSGDRKRAIHENMDYDLYYIRNCSFFLDGAILIETLIFALRGI